MILLMESRLQNRFAAFASITLLICVMLPAHAGQFIVDVNTDQSVYSPGNVATIYVDLTNSTAATSGALARNGRRCSGKPTTAPAAP